LSFKNHQNQRLAFLSDFFPLRSDFIPISQGSMIANVRLGLFCQVNLADS